MQTNRVSERQHLLDLGIPDDQQDALLHYNQPWFAGALSHPLPNLPLPPCACTTTWEGYAEEATDSSWQEVLRERFPAFRFAIVSGMSQQPDYQQACRKGSEASGEPHTFSKANFLQFEVCHPPSGSIPVLTVEHRGDFEDLLRILLHQNETVPIPATMGAVLISGLPNPDRIAGLKQNYFDSHPGARLGSWLREWEQIRVADRDAWQDRLVIVSTGPYSALPAAAIGLSQEAWQAASRIIRIHHECAHAFCKGLLGHMGNNLLDECIADFMGLRAAFGHFSASLFLQGMGVQTEGSLSPTGRMKNYLQQPELPATAWENQGRLLAKAAAAIEAWDRSLPPFDPNTPAHEAQWILHLARFSLIDLSRGLLQSTRITDHPIP
jgi:hypothetical protein